MPGQPVDKADLEVIEGMPVKSYITGHADGDKLRLAPTTLRGMAWAGEERIVKVDVSTDGGSIWKPAELSEKSLPFTWRLWSFGWAPPDLGTLQSCRGHGFGRARSADRRALESIGLFV